jgi:hypothetical protein
LIKSNYYSQNPVYGPKAAVGISTRIEPVTVELLYMF